MTTARFSRIRMKPSKKDIAWSLLQKCITWMGSTSKVQYILTVGYLYANDSSLPAVTGTYLRNTTFAPHVHGANHANHPCMGSQTHGYEGRSGTIGAQLLNDSWAPCIKWISMIIHPTGMTGLLYLKWLTHLRFLQPSCYGHSQFRGAKSFIQITCVFIIYIYRERERVNHSIITLILNIRM